jgi:hypothetical protein
MGCQCWICPKPGAHRDSGLAKIDHLLGDDHCGCGLIRNDKTGIGTSLNYVIL